MSLAVAEKSLSLIDRQMTHLTRLVDDLLDVGRIAAGKIELRRSRCRRARSSRSASRPPSRRWPRSPQPVRVTAATEEHPAVRGPHAAGAGDPEPAAQCLQVLAAGRADLDYVDGPPPHAGDPDHRPWPGHHARVARQHLRPVRAGRPPRQHGAGRAGHRAVAVPLAGGDAWRLGLGRERGPGWAPRSRCNRRWRRRSIQAARTPMPPPAPARRCACCWWTTTATPPTAWRSCSRCPGHAVDDCLLMAWKPCTRRRALRRHVALIDLAMPGMDGFAVVHAHARDAHLTNTRYIA